MVNSYYRKIGKCRKVKEEKKNHLHPEVVAVNLLAHFLPYFYVYIRKYTHLNVRFD